MQHGSVVRHGILDAVFFAGRRHRIYSRLVAESGARAGDSVLDVGCGTGYLTRLAAEAVAPGGAAEGVDPSVEAITDARQQAGPDNCTFTEGIAEALDAADGSFDVVVSSLMIHHLPEVQRQRAIDEMFRVLRPGGSVLVAEFRPPTNRLGRGLVSVITGHRTMSNNRVDLLDPIIREAGFEQLRHGDLRPWITYVQARRGGTP